MNSIADQKQALVRAQASIANRFFWIAGLTLISTFSLLSTSTGGFVSAMSLGVVQLVDAVVPDKNIAIGFSAIMILLFAAFGIFARNGNAAVFIAGMAIYALDAILLAFFKEWIAVGIHAFILYRLFTGLQYALEHKKLIKQEEEELRRQRVAEAWPGR